jgi:hypothetical protein
MWISSQNLNLALPSYSFLLFCDRNIFSFAIDKQGFKIFIIKKERQAFNYEIIYLLFSSKTEPFFAL